MMEYQKIVVLSDVHIHASDAPTWQHNNQSLVDAVAFINDQHSDALYCVILGDLSHQGSAQSYRLLQQILAPLTVPVQLMIGNHDNRGAFCQRFTDAPVDDNGYVQHRIDVGDEHRLIFLDTASGIEPGSAGRDIGILCSARLQWLEYQLQNSRDKQVLLFMHHPPHNVGFAGMDAIKLANGDAFYQLIKSFANVKQLLCGHIHRTISGCHQGVAFTTFKSTGLQMPLNFSSVDTSLSIAEPPSIGVILLGDQQVVIHEDYYSLAPQMREKDWLDSAQAIAYWQEAINFPMTSLRDHNRGNRDE